MNHNHRIKIKDIYIDMKIYMIVKEMLYVNLKHFNKIQIKYYLLYKINKMMYQLLIIYKHH